MALSDAQAKKLQVELKDASYTITKRKIHGSDRFCLVAKGVTVKPAGFKGKGSGMMPLGCFGSKDAAEGRQELAASGKYKVGSAARKKKAGKK